MGSGYRQAVGTDGFWALGQLSKRITGSESQFETARLALGNCCLILNARFCTPALRTS
jgi:hypothetical protein